MEKLHHIAKVHGQGYAHQWYQTWNQHKWIFKVDSPSGVIVMRSLTDLTFTWPLPCCIEVHMFQRLSCSHVVLGSVFSLLHISTSRPLILLGLPNRGHEFPRRTHLRTCCCCACWPTSFSHDFCPAALQYKCFQYYLVDPFFLVFEFSQHYGWTLEVSFISNRLLLCWWLPLFRWQTQMNFQGGPARLRICSCRSRWSTSYSHALCLVDLCYICFLYIILDILCLLAMYMYSTCPRTWDMPGKSRPKNIMFKCLAEFSGAVPWCVCVARNHKKNKISQEHQSPNNKLQPRNYPDNQFFCDMF